VAFIYTTYCRLADNSALPALTCHVAEAIFSSPNSSSVPVPTHLVDAYCGSGLFAITLQDRFQKVAGVEIDANAIKRARLNVELNAIDPAEKMEFLAGSAEAIFATVRGFPRMRTALIIDPPRRGCDAAFLSQMLEFGAGTVVYVSCNVHSQARDMEVILKGEVSLDGGEKRGGYVLESVRGLDLFPQTSHVESIAVLRLAERL
jgi:tRNA (uracil-5-)-methyltransferase